MPISVIETIETAGTTPSLTFATTPAAGDVVVIATTIFELANQTVTGVSGMGASWTLAYAGTQQEFWVGTGATSSGPVSVTFSDSGIRHLRGWLLRGLASTTALGNQTSHLGGTTALAGPSVSAGAGQIVLSSARTEAGAQTFPSTSVPASGWTAVAPYSLSGRGAGSAYRIPSGTAETHRTDVYSDNTSEIWRRSVATLVIGEEGGTSPTAALSLAGSVAAPAWTLAGAYTLAPVGAPASVTLAGSLAVPTWTISGAFEVDAGEPPTVPATTARNRVGGRVRSGIGVVRYSPPIIEPPTPSPVAHVREVAQAFGPIDLAGPQPSYTVTEASVVRDRDRIVVGGKDVTYLGGVPTPTPDFSLIEPTLYGAGSLSFPQIPATFITPGVRPHRWLRKGAPVTVERVRDGAVVAVDFKGFVADWNIDGGTLSVQLGGELSGRAQLQNKQLPIFPRMRDLGRHAFMAVRQARLPFKPQFGPTTGIVIKDEGGTGLLDHINTLCAKAVRKNGNQFTIMPDPADGIYQMTVKDRETIHATAYFDDARLKPSLRSDMAEEPNRIFVSGVTPKGQKVKFGHYPGLRQGPPAPYPFSNTGATFGEGTTNADTDTGDGIRVLGWRLVTVGYITAREAERAAYDADMADAVADLQDDAGLPSTGVMNLATWRALFDLDVTGYSLIHAAIHPAAQDSSVRKWNYTPTGAQSGLNPDYDPHAIPVDLNVSMTSSHERQQMRQWARAELRAGRGDNWVGTLDLTSGSAGGGMALIAGEHNPGDPLTEADVMRPRDLRPGMNVWAPQFMGGTLFHISGVTVSNSGQSVQLALDTRARDTMKVWEVVTRNRESRKDPARVWINTYRSSQVEKDALVTFDEIGGTLDHHIPLEQGWNVVPVVAGQEGTIARLRVRLTENLEFAVAVFGRSMSTDRLERLVPAPLAKTRNDQGGTGEPWYEKRHIRNALRERFLLFAAGTHDEPCGMGDKRKIDGNGNATGASPNGVEDTEATFSFRTFAEPVIYLAVWAPQACELEPGRVMWNQLEEGS